MNTGATLLALVADDREMVAYRPKLRKVAGSVTGAILLQQIIWNWKRKRFEPFYKFNSPCDHPLYRDGDSWEEELGFSVPELDTARKKIARKVASGQSKKQALQEVAIIYWTDGDRVTWYDVNPDLLVNMISECYADNKLAQAMQATAPKVEAGIGDLGTFYQQQETEWTRPFVPQVPKPIYDLAKHFEQTTGIFPANEHEWGEKWQPQLEAIFGASESLDEGKKAMDAAVGLWRDEGRKVFSPRTIYKNACNIAQGWEHARRVVVNTNGHQKSIAGVL